jgi:hypothetical protein
MAYKISDNSVIDDNRELTAVSVTPSTNLVVPYGTTANRPTGAVGKLYFDTDLGKLLVHNGTTWVESSTAAGSTGGDFAVHGAKYVMPMAGGTMSSVVTLTPVPYNEAITSLSFVRHKASVVSPTSFSAYVKFKGMQDEVQLNHASTNNVGGTGGWPCPQETSGHSGIYNVDRNMFQPHASLSLDNTAININTGGECANGNTSGIVKSWMFDSKFPNEAFLMSATGVFSESTQRGGYGIYKYSDTQYIVWSGEGAATTVAGSGSNLRIDLRSFNPNNIVENQNSTSAGAYADWFKLYEPSNNYLETGQAMCYGVWKSATPNQLTVMATNNMSQNTDNIPVDKPAVIGIFDININTGAVVPHSTTPHLEFVPTINNNLWTTTNNTHLMPSSNNFTVCECSTHVTMITWPANASGHPYLFWIYDKATRNLRYFKPEIYDNTPFNNGTIENFPQPNRLWMNHFKMNDKIYLTTCEQGNTHSTHEGVHIYETSATAATPYMRIYNDTNNHQAIQNPQKFQQIRPLKSADSFTFQHNHADDYYWYDSSNTLSTANIGDGTACTGLTVNPETSKTIIQSTFANVKSGAWSGSTPTYRLNPRKSNVTSDQWTATDGSNTPPNNPGQNRTTFWTGNLVRRKFFGGGTQ